jgi:hypothetical protein
MLPLVALVRVKTSILNTIKVKFCYAELINHREDVRRAGGMAPPTWPQLQMEGGGQFHALGDLAPKNEPLTHCIGGRL